MAVKAERLTIVLNIAQAAEQAVAVRLQEFREFLTNEEAQLAQLDEYRQQYLDAYSNRRVNVGAQELVGYSQFILRMGELRTEQAKKVDSLRGQLAGYIQAWSQAHQKCKSLAELIERKRVERSNLKEKQSQKLMDEFATQGFLKNRNEI